MEEYKKTLLKNKGIEESEIENIFSYDENSGEVIYKDNSKRTVTEVVARCMGYFRPVDQWNIGKRQEHADRVYFNQKKAIEKIDKIK